MKYVLILCCALHIHVHMKPPVLVYVNKCLHVCDLHCVAAYSWFFFLPPLHGVSSAACFITYVAVHKSDHHLP